MGLIPKIEIRQDSPFFIYLKDVTPNYSAENPGGYGTPNALVTDTDKVRIELTYPNGASVTFEALYKRGDADWKIDYSDLQNIQKNIDSGCTTCGEDFEITETIFPSGCYKIKYKVIGYGKKIVEKSNYFLSIIGNPTDHIWVKVNGVFLDVTIAGDWLGNNFQWSSLATFDEHIEYELRSGSTVKQYGTVTKNGLGQFQTQIGTDFVVLGETAQSFVLTYNEVTKYHELMFKVLGLGEEVCYDFFSDPCARGSDMSELILIKSKLDLLNGETDCVYVSDLLKRINILIKSVEE